MLSAEKRVLVIDDSELIRDAVGACLTRDGFLVRSAAGGLQARALMSKEPADLVIVDLQMPGEDGFSIARFIRESYDCGIIMLTGKADVVDRVVGLEVGADDYICKPYEPRELLARVRSVLRRSEHRVRPVTNHHRVSYGCWSFDPEGRSLITADQQSWSLTGAEFKLLDNLIKARGRVLTREYLMNAVYDRPWDYFDRSIDVLVTRLRRKLKSAGAVDDHIKSARGEGYVFGGI